MITIVQVRNPLQPSDGRVTREACCEEGWTLQDYLHDVVLLDTDKPPTVSVNGLIIPRELWETKIPHDGDFIVVSPHVAGGSTWRTLASIAVIAASIAAVAFLGPAGIGFSIGALSSATTASIIAGGISIAGNLLISTFMSTPAQKGSSPSYAFDGPRSLAQSGTVIPKGYGTFLSGGNIIASFVDVEGPDQYINVLVCYGYGPARSITQVQINGKDISTYQNVQYYTRLGSNSQTPMPNFNRIVNAYPQDTQCLAGVPVVVPGTGDLTQIGQVDIAFPNGAFVLTADNNTIPVVITYQVQWCVSGTNNWQSVLQPQTTQDVVTYASDGTPNAYPTWVVVATDQPPNCGIVYATDSGSHTPGEPWSGSLTVETFQPNGNHSTYSKTFYGEWQLTNPELNQVQVLTWTDGYVDFVAADRSPVYNRTTIYYPAPGKYDIQVIKYGSARLHDDAQFGDNNSPQIGEQVWIHSVNEITLLDLAYPNMILVGVRALATNQINGSNLSITSLIEYGLRTKDNNVLPTALQAFEEDNPACVAADMMLDGLYGGGRWPGITAANINRYIDEWISWAELNDQLVDDGNGGSIRRHVFNGVLDNESNLWDQLNVVGRMSRAQIIPLGRDYGVFVDQPDTPVQMFTMGNITQDSFTETWLDIDSRANQVEIQFADSTRYYRQDNPLVYMDPANQNAGVVVKNVRVDGKGITIPAQAWHLARYKERQNQYLLRSGSFTCDVDAIACRPGNLVILQHDVPQWGWGGRTLPNSTASAVIIDRADAPFAAGTAYSLIIIFPALQRYAGTISSAAPVIDGTGANLGTALNLSSFDNTERVTRCVVTVPGTGGAAATKADCPITSSSAGSVVIQPIAGFTPAAGMAYALYDTDVMQSCTVSGVTTGSPAPANCAVVRLGTPLPAAPQDFSTYFYGQTGSQKIVRIATIHKLSEFRAKLEWIDYNPLAYVDATPVVGETSALNTSNPAVTSLVGSETIKLVSGSYVGYADLTWRLGPDTVGVGIYGYIVGGNNSQPGGQPQLLARLTNYPTSWQMQIDAGNEWTFIVVGFDVNNRYAAFKSAPTATITFNGVAANLLLGSSFASGFTFWNVTPRTGDTLVPVFTDDGEAQYTVAGSTLATAMTLLYQVVTPAKWAVGDYLMLSAYFMDSCAVSTAPNVGELIATLSFLNSSGTLISSVAGQVALSGVTPSLTRCNTACTAVPTGTASIVVAVGVGGSGISIPVGSVLTSSHLLLEIGEAGQTVPSDWADIDVNGQVLDFFINGSSTGLRVQGSVLPNFTGQFSFASTDTTITISWSGLVILWPDGAYTYVVDGSIAITGLTVSSSYYAFLYFDIFNGGVHAQVPTTAVGTPAILSATYDAIADAACNQDNRVQLTPGGLAVSTEAAGLSGGGSGGGRNPGRPVPPIDAPA